MKSVTAIIYVIGIILLVALILAVSFLFTSGLFNLVCYIFGFAFSWKRAIAFWVVIVVVLPIVKSMLN